MNDKPKRHESATDRQESEILYDIKNNPELVDSSKHVSSWVPKFKNDCESGFRVKGKLLVELSTKESLDAFADHLDDPMCGTLPPLARLTLYRNYQGLWKKSKGGKSRKGKFGPVKKALKAIMDKGVSGEKEILDKLDGFENNGLVFEVDERDEKVIYTNWQGRRKEVGFETVKNDISSLRNHRT